MDKIKKLSEAIRYGSAFLGETKSFFGYEDEHGRCACGCALGTAYLATISRTPPSLMIPDDIMEPLTKRFGVPRDVLMEISVKHFRGELSRSECADWLASKGY